jgi:hypothetical protein
LCPEEMADGKRVEDIHDAYTPPPCQYMYTTASPMITAQQFYL